MMGKHRMPDYEAAVFAVGLCIIGVLAVIGLAHVLRWILIYLK